MKIRLLALCLALSLVIPGCAGLSIGDYPRVEPSAAPQLEEQVLVLALPAGADDILLNMTYLLGAKLSELSQGALSLELRQVEEGEILGTSIWDLALYTNEDLINADPDLAFLAAPFLFPSRESFLTILSNAQSPVRDNPLLEQQLGGQVIGVYYGGAMGFFCRSRFYEEIGFSSADLGLLESSAPGAQVYQALDGLKASTVVLASQEDLMDLAQGQEIKLMEAPRGAQLPEGGWDTFKYYEDTCHRYLGYWLVLGEQVDPALDGIIRQAVAYTLASQEQERVAAEEEAMAAYPGGALGNNQGDYHTLYQGANTLYRRKEEGSCVTPEIWEALEPYLTQS